MPKAYIDPTAVKDYVLLEDREDQNPPIFQIGVPDLKSQDVLSATMAESVTNVEKDCDCDGSPECEKCNGVGRYTETNVNMSGPLINAALRAGLRGWVGWTKPSGDLVECGFKNGCISDESLSQLTLANRIELAGECIAMLTLPEKAQD